MAKGKTVVYIRDDETAFLNVDVEVFAKYPLDPLAAALGDDLSVQNIGLVGRGLFHLQFSPCGPKNADAAIRELTERIRSVPRSARRLWNDASRRVFDVGFQGGFKPHSGQFDVAEEGVASIAALGGSVRVTIYPAPDVEALGPKSPTTKTARSSWPENPPRKAARRKRAGSLAGRSRR